ncbi:MAG: sensor histidine kinase [Jatrophihabitans sp.]|uniref:sensor histidine kinase n=1 Tax=Jatrophihabitans sp. TaxID=1932789 RepID=UPI003912AC4C
MSAPLEYVPHQVAPQADPAGPPPTSASEEVLEPVPRRPRLWLRSLTSRLVLGVVALVVVLVAAVGGCTYFALKSFLTSRLDQQLQSTASGSLRTLFNGGGPQAGATLRAQEVWAVALSPKGSLLAYPMDTGVESLRLSAGDSKALVGLSEGATTTIRTADGKSLRVITRSAVASDPDGSEEQAVAVIGLSTDEEQRTLSRLVTLEVVIGVAAIAVAFVATTWGVRRSLRNLYRVTGTAQEVAAELSPTGAGLDRRVPVVEEGTEVGQLAESMNTLLAAVETQFGARLESEQRMRQFLADASHELRTPLTSIRGYAELSRMQRAAGDSHADNLDRIESEGTRMSRLVDDLLLLARGDADEAVPIPQELLDIPDVLDDAVGGSRAAFPERDISMTIGAVPAVVGDRDQLVRVVRNLVTNAAVHTAPGRPIRVAASTDAGGVVITVADGGPGLPPDQAARVFERFWRADKARTRARGGSGLGMSIVAAIVQAHGGSVRFDSSVEAGSTVTVWLPAAG